MKALACERPQDTGQPLARFSVCDILIRARACGIERSYSTLWRLLHRDALRPWFQKQWLVPRDPRLLEKAAPVLDLYHRQWQGEPLHPLDVVLCGDELTNLRACARHHPATAPRAGQPGHYEFSHDRGAERRHYVALLDVFRGQVYGEVTPTGGITPFETLVARVVQSLPFQAAARIFLIVDNGSAHHPTTSPARLAALDPRLTVVHLPVHSSWLNQIEIWFSLLKRKALTPLDLPDERALRERIYGFQRYHNEHGGPFTWKYTTADLNRYLERLEAVGAWPPEPQDRTERQRQPLTV